MNHYFAAEALILERLRTQVSGCRLLSGARDLKGIHALTGRSPAIYLLYDGQDARMNAGFAQVIDQLWLIILAIKNDREASSGQGERDEAGPLLIQITQALLGWVPSSAHGPMKMASAPGASFAGSLALFPVRFTTRLLLQGI